MVQQVTCRPPSRFCRCPRYRLSVLRSAADFLLDCCRKVYARGAALMSMRHLRFLRSVDEVARAGSIRRAAEQLHVTASAVNRRVMDLEEELGAALFERRPRGMRLTAAGELFVRYIREQTGDVERMKSQIEDLKGLRRGTVRIACSQALALDFLPREIAAFRTRHPLVSFNVRVLDPEQAMTALATYEVDLGVGFRPPFLSNFQPLMSLQPRIVAG